MGLGEDTVDMIEKLTGNNMEGGINCMETEQFDQSSLMPRKLFIDELSEKLDNIELYEDDAVETDSGIASPAERSFTRSNDGDVKDESSMVIVFTAEDFYSSDSGEESDDDEDMVKEKSSTIKEGYPKEEAQILMSYHFHIPDYLCGKMIGNSGGFINQLMSSSRCNVMIEDEKDKIVEESTETGDLVEYKRCSVEGTRSNIDKCLDMIKEKFVHHLELTLDQINKPEPVSITDDFITLTLTPNVTQDVYISSIVSSSHVFLHLPSHPSYPALERLNMFLPEIYNNYSTPQVLRPILPDTIAVARNNDAWYRCLVLSYNEVEDCCQIKYVDYGIYDSIKAEDLRQIRSDFLSLPFQAVECYLANVDSNVASPKLEKLIAGHSLQAESIGYSGDGIPRVLLQRLQDGTTTLINEELRDGKITKEVESVVVPHAAVKTHWIDITPPSPPQNYSLPSPLSPLSPSCKDDINIDRMIKSPTKDPIPSNTDSQTLIQDSHPLTVDYISSVELSSSISLAEDIPPSDEETSSLIEVAYSSAEEVQSSGEDAVSSEEHINWASDEDSSWDEDTVSSSSWLGSNPAIVSKEEDQSSGEERITSWASDGERSWDEDVSSSRWLDSDPAIVSVQRGLDQLLLSFKEKDSKDSKETKDHNEWKVSRHQQKKSQKKKKGGIKKIAPQEKLFCFFFNKSKCEKGRHCEYVHKVAPICQFGRRCFKQFCVFKHPNDVRRNRTTVIVL